MTKSMGLMVCAGMALCSVAAASDPGTPISAASSGQKFQAQRVAKVQRNVVTGEVRQVGEWVNIGVTPRGPATVALWDSFESCPLGDPGSTPVGFGTNTANNPTDCGGASNRWYFGGDYYNPHIITDYQAATPGDVSGGDFAIWFNPPASAGLLIFVFNFDSISLDGAVLGNGEAVDGFIDGVILDYGAQGPVVGGWGQFYYENLPSGFLSTAADGEGGYEVICAETFTDSDGDGENDLITLHADAAGDGFGVQLMLWSTGEDEVPVAQAGRVGNGTAIQYDDDAPTDGLFDDPDGDGFINEAYDYTFGVAPNPLSACMQVCGAGGPPGCPADFNGDGFLDFFDADAFVACFEGIECPPGKDCDYNQDGFCDFFDSDAFVADFEAGC